jgi:proteasome lid subunit RPN8/RPN11
MKLKIKYRYFESIEKHALKVFPLECCGLLIGKMGKGIFEVKKVVPAKNIHKSEVSFEADAELVYRALDAAEAKGLDLIGIYHSHPNMCAYVSAVDAEIMKLWPNVAWLVLGVSENQIIEKKVFMLKESKIVGLEIKID